MTSPLTSNDEQSPGRRSSSPPKKMSSYTSGHNGGRSSGGGESSYAVYPPPTYPPGWVPGVGVVPQSDQVPLSTIVPGSVRPTEAQLNTAYGYAIQRQDGSFTRLIRADNLEPINGIPQSQGPQGLIIVPEPRQPSPRRQLAEVYIPRGVSWIIYVIITFVCLYLSGRG